MTDRHLVPSQLPADLPVFAGRADDLAALDAQAAAVDDVAAPVVVVVSGTAGVGKTTMAVRWAHWAAARFPDGQLYVNMRGFDPGGVALHLADAVRRFLDAFQMPVQRLPDDFDAQVNTYRTLLANRRLLVVLDNARDAEQVRPLLPTAPGCLALVTSRNPLIPLAVTEGARVFALGMLSAPEARELLARRLGDQRATAEPEDDLLRTYAIEQSELHDSDEARDATLRRLVEHYVEATRAQGVQSVMFWPLTVDEPSATGTMPTPAVRLQAMAWLDTERDVLLATAG